MRQGQIGSQLQDSKYGPLTEYVIAPILTTRLDEWIR